MFHGVAILADPVPSGGTSLLPGIVLCGVGFVGILAVPFEISRIRSQPSGRGRIALIVAADLACLIARRHHVAKVHDVGDTRLTPSAPGTKIKAMWKTTGAGAVVSLVGFAVVLWICGSFLMPLILWFGSRPLLPADFLGFIVDALMFTLVVAVSIATALLRRWAQRRKTEIPHHAH